MLVLVSFVLVLAAAVTLVVGLLQSGLTLIYLSIACSVLAGIVLAVAVLRGRPEPQPAAAGRSFTPPARPQVPASVGAPSSGAEATTSWSAPSSTAPPAPPPPPPSPTPAPTQDPATQAAGTALLGRLRGKRAQQEGEAPAAPEPVAVPPPAAGDTGPASAQETMEIPVVRGTEEDDDGFPIADYDRLRATELLSRLPALDRNQLEAVRQRETSSKNRFTVMSRIDSLLAAQQDPAWQVADDEWESEAGTDAESEAAVIEAEALDKEEDFGAPLDDEELAAGEVEDDEVDELVTPVGDFPIAGYDSLTVGQILPRLSDLDADQLAQVRAREEQGRGRGTILDRVDRLAARSGTGAGAMAMPPAAPARKAPARKAPARKAPAEKAPAAKKSPRAAKKSPIAAPPAPLAKNAAKKARGRKAAPTETAPVPMPPATPAPTARKSPARTRKAAAPATPESPPMKEAVKKARAAKAPAKKSTKKSTKRP